MTRLDRFILAGRPWDRPVYLLRFERLRWAVVVALVVAVMGTGALLTVDRVEQRRACEQRNANTLRTRQVLRDLADAARDRNDRRTESIFRGLVSNQPLPRC